MLKRTCRNCIHCIDIADDHRYGEVVATCIEGGGIGDLHDIDKVLTGNDCNAWRDKITKQHRCDDVTEVCICGGTARPVRYEGNVLILTCDTCNDSFEADESQWLIDSEIMNENDNK